MTAQPSSPARGPVPRAPATLLSAGRMAALRHAVAALGAIAMGAYAQGAHAQEPSTLWQLSPAAGIRGAVYDSVGTVGDLRPHGDHGLGTAASLNGEMVVLDGKFYRVDSQGTAEMVSDNQPVTFGIVTQWRGGILLPVEPGLRYCFACQNASARDTTFQIFMNQELGEYFGTINWFYSLRLEGTFDRVITRTFAEQKPPYPCWDSAQAHQIQDTFPVATGTMVGFMEPGFVNGTSISGYHLHFLTTPDANGVRQGGHVISFTTTDAIQLRAAPIMNFELRVPSIPEYKSADLYAPCTSG